MEMKVVYLKMQGLKDRHSPNDLQLAEVTTDYIFYLTLYFKIFLKMIFLVK